MQRSRDDEVAAIAREVLSRSGDCRLVAIDGPGGAGKSTFAALLAAELGSAPVIHTDDFASAANPIDWWPRLREQVVMPLAGGSAARYERYDWPTDSMAEWHTVDPAPVVIIEGVSAARREWSEHLSFVIWVQTPRDIRLARGLERDGADAREQWHTWMAEEDAHFDRDAAERRADWVVDGTLSR